MRYRQHKLPVARTERLNRRARRHYEDVWSVGAWVASAFVLGVMIWDLVSTILYLVP